MIRSGELGPGDFVPSERELMQCLSVGRPAVREAMQSLHRMGLVDIRHGGRARVSEPSLNRMIESMGETMRHVLTHSAASLEHLKEARAIFEMQMARIAAKKGTAADIDRLQRILNQQEAAKVEPAQFLHYDGEFHREIAVISGNPILSAVSESVFRWLADFHLDLVRVPGLEELTIAEHQAILDAISARDPQLAARAMNQHLMRANTLYRRIHDDRRGVR
jgi:DNA-binding FadR family transcriptional regulator